MGGSKKTYEKIRQQSIIKKDYESDWFDRILYTKDKIKKSSLKNGGVLDLTSRKKSRRKRVVVER